MPDEMPEQDAAFIEAECLRVFQEREYRDLRRVKIGPIERAGSGPNWEVLSFDPPLPPMARDIALELIAPLRQRYALKRRAE